MTGVERRALVRTEPVSGPVESKSEVKDVEYALKLKGNRVAGE